MLCNGCTHSQRQVSLNLRHITSHTPGCNYHSWAGGMSFPNHKLLTVLSINGGGCTQICSLNMNEIKIFLILLQLLNSSECNRRRMWNFGLNFIFKYIYQITYICRNITFSVNERDRMELNRVNVSLFDSSFVFILTSSHEIRDRAESIITIIIIMLPSQLLPWLSESEFFTSCILHQAKHMREWRSEKVHYFSFQFILRLRLPDLLKLMHRITVYYTNSNGVNGGMVYCCVAWYANGWWKWLYLRCCWWQR